MSDIESKIDSLPGSSFRTGSNLGNHILDSWFDKRRIFIFVCTFAFCCLVSLPYNFMRAPIYDSKGSLLLKLPKRYEAVYEKSDTQHVEAQRQVLISNPMMIRILERLEEKEQLKNTPYNRLSKLKKVLNVIPAENMNVLMLSAIGKNRELLTLLVNTWIDVYLESSADLEKSSYNSANKNLNQQVNELERKVVEKRLELERYREKHDIVSIERAENWTPERYKGLMEALKKAEEEQTITESQFQAQKNMIDRGKLVTREQDQGMLANLEGRAVEVQEELRGLQEKYTSEFLRIDSHARSLVKKLELLQEDIRLKRKESQQLAFAEAEQSQIAARQTVIDLQQKLATHKRMTATFSNNFKEHEALEEELTQLEELYNEVSGRLVKTEVTDKQQLPEITVLERAFVPEFRVGPQYVRDAGICVGGSFLLGIMAVFFYEFLTRPPKEEQVASVQNQSIVYNISDPKKIQMPAIQEVKSELMLEQHLPRELTQSEVQAIADAADNSTLLLVNTILSGLSIEEAAGLCWNQINLKTGEIDVPGENARTVPISARLRAMFAQYVYSDEVVDGHIWKNKEKDPLGVDDLTEFILDAVQDANLINSSEIDEHAIRYTYLAFLIRQGIRRDELERISGKLPHVFKTAYSILSPPGSGSTLEELETVYPTLQS
jgi:succinoglycan biosynthesis transport protein ExoP